MKRTKDFDQHGAAPDEFALFPRVVFLVYMVLLGVIMYHHELWGDEIHSWNIVKASPSLSALLRNIRFEGHPPLWYLILWPLTRFTHDPVAMQVVQYLIAVSVVFLLLFRSPFPLVARLLLPFGYFLLYEYAALSRNYAIGVLLVCCVCIVLSRPRPKYGWYYVFLFLLSNTHLIGLILAASFQVYVLLRTRSWVHFLLGGLLLLPAAGCILPPPDSQLNAGFWLHWTRDKPIILAQAPLRAFFPMPAWWEYHWWNTECLLGLPLWLVGLCSLALCWLALAVLQGAARVLFLVNVLGTLFVGLVFPLTTSRYCGFLFIGFLAAYWLSERRRRLGYLLLALQIPGALFAAYQDYRHPFSFASKAPVLVAEAAISGAEAPTLLVCDYWALNPLVTFCDRPFYCLDLHREMSFLQWNNELSRAMHAPHRYADGVQRLFDSLGTRSVYLMSTASPLELQRADSLLIYRFDVRLVDLREDAIEKGSNLYLYLVALPPPPVEPVRQRNP